MPKSSPDFDKEPDTRPDLGKFACPGCPGPDGRPLGHVVEEVWSADGQRYSTIKRTCDVCWGSKTIGREGLERWRAARG